MYMYTYVRIEKIDEMSDMYMFLFNVNAYKLMNMNNYYGIAQTVITHG